MTDLNSLVTVRFSLALPSGPLISIKPRGPHTLSGLDMSVIWADSKLTARRGDGHPEITALLPGSPLDIFLYDQDMPSPRLPVRPNVAAFAYRDNDTLAVHLSWSHVDQRHAPGHLLVIWVHADIVAGGPPLIATGADAMTIREYMTGPHGLSAAKLKHHTTPVLKMSRREERARVQSHRQRMEARMKNPIRLKNLHVGGLRGFKTEATLRLAEPNGKDGSGLTIVVGANNSGKSTIWEAFDAVAHKLKTGVSFSEQKRNRDTDAVSIPLSELMDHSTSLSRKIAVPVKPATDGNRPSRTHHQRWSRCLLVDGFRSHSVITPCRSETG